ncbi:MAG: hypothetical protein ACD_46C00570G0008 [uncultured bacterium]|nr:MAG: hypothetical protein ACD_46C00570G0008 [uncultured bacterium]
MNQPNLKIMVIDDNPEIHRDFVKILTFEPDKDDDSFSQLDKEIFGDSTQMKEPALPKFQIDGASQGKEGFERIREAYNEGNPYALAFVDIRMPPGWDGVETIKHIWEVDKNIQVVICTAYSDYSWEETIEKLGQTDNLLILKKPFDNIAVRQLACALTKKWLLMKQTHEQMISLEEIIKERTQSLEKSLSLTRATLESSADGILVIDNEKKVIDFNNRFIEMWQVPPIILELKDFNILFEYMLNQLKDPSSYENNINELFAQREKIGIDQVELVNGKVFEYYSQPHKLSDQSIGRVWSYRDITKRVNLEEKLHYQATRDELTGLLNRYSIMEYIYKYINKSKKNERASLLFLDLDRFKLINDSLGHATGDKLIKIFAEKIKPLADDRHIIARLGGDEFVIFITNIQNQQETIEYANKILKKSNEAVKLNDRQVVVTASIGISFFPSDGKSADELLQFSDAAMYQAKKLGSNQIQFYTEELNSQALTRLEQESELRNAIARKEFFLCYQPEFDVFTGKLVAVEALIRWNHPKKGVVLPMDFIPLAEESGLIVTLGDWVLKSSCRQNKKWQDAGLTPICVAVNVTAHQFKQINFIESLKNILKETDLDPKYLKIEVTENTIISEPVVVTVMTQLKKMNVQVVLDDFGTGYSSLSYLKKIPIDGLKIDQSFIQNISHDRCDEVIIRAIISMAQSLNLEVLAEGVESQDQLKFLKSNKCKEVQGFYFSKPLLPDELEEILRGNINQVKEDSNVES